MGKHPIVHLELAARDQAQSATFYHELFGWQTHHHPEMNYTTFATEAGPGGGFITVDEHMTKPGEIRVYVATDDIDSTLKRVEALGGKTLMGKSEIPHVGWFGVFADPAGTTVCLFTAGRLEGGPLPLPADLRTTHAIFSVKFAAKDPAESARFYHDLFGWKINVIPELNYTQFETGDGMTGGFLKIGERGIPAGLVCVDVSTGDVAQTLARVTALGGKVVHPKEEIPGFGWMGGLEDPAGTQLWLFTPTVAAQAAAAD